VATSVEMLSGRRKRDYEAESLNSQGAASTESGRGAGGSADTADQADEPAEEADLEAAAEDEQPLVLA
jgi:hypothetical protein